MWAASPAAFRGIGPLVIKSSANFQYLPIERQNRNSREKFQAAMSELSVARSYFLNHELGHIQAKLSSM